ncbi:MAG: hypothetical protein ABR543_07550 [Gemmatimonadaceae bacterium]
MRFGNLCTTAVALAAAAILTPVLAAQTVSKQGTTTTTVIPIYVSATSPGPGTVSLQWNPVSGAVSYRIERAKIYGPEPEEGWSRVIATQVFVIADRYPNNSYTDTGLWDGMTYQYVVTAQFDAKASTSYTAFGRVTLTITP